MITHVLDTSAILAHYFHEPGAELVNTLLTDSSIEVGLPAISLIDLRQRLSASVPDSAEASRAFRLYAEELLTAIPVTREIVAAADSLPTAGALTLTEAIAAATARQLNAVLVHRHPHFHHLPRTLLQQCALPLEA